MAGLRSEFEHQLCCRFSFAPSTPVHASLKQAGFHPCPQPLLLPAAAAARAQHGTRIKGPPAGCSAPCTHTTQQPPPSSSPVLQHQQQRQRQPPARAAAAGLAAPPLRTLLPRASRVCAPLLRVCCASAMEGQGRGRGRGWYFKQKYGGGGRGGRGGGGGRGQLAQDDCEQDSGGGGSNPSSSGGRRGGWHSQQQRHQQQQPAADDSDDDAGGGGYGAAAPPARAASLRGSGAQLAAELQRLDGKGYKAYNDIRGAWQCDGFLLLVDHVQGDPYASPSRLRVQVPAASAQLPAHLYSSKLRRTALADWLARAFAGEANRASAAAAGQARGWHGAKGGDVTVDLPGQHVLERTAVLVSAGGDVEARFTVGLPAQGRSIMGPWAAQILTQHVAKAVRAALMYPALDAASIWRHITTVEDTQALRDALPGLGLVGFAGDGAILPRKSGASDLPMPHHPTLVPFASPPSLAVTVTLPHAGTVRGMGIRAGITLIAGGGFHGKSTLIQALEAGVYNKVPGDGRELVVMVPDAVKVSAEDGRRVEGVDISPFITNLPGGVSTSAFASDDASGSTSQAAAIQEALEAGARVLLMDEDTCATNFMMRDARMAALVAPDKEPITPFSARIAQLRAAGVSTLLVMGGSGDYFAAADCVIVMDCYVPSDATAAAHAIAAQHAATLGAAGVAAAATPPPPLPGAPGDVWLTQRLPLQVAPRAPGPGEHGAKTYVRSTHAIQYGNEDVQLSAAEQLVDRSQTRAVAEALKWLQARLQQQQAQQQGQRTLAQWLDELEAAFDEQGLDVLAPYQLPGNLARPRRYEVAAAVNRIRTLRVTQAQRPQAIQQLLQR